MGFCTVTRNTEFTEDVGVVRQFCLAGPLALDALLSLALLRE